MGRLIYPIPHDQHCHVVEEGGGQRLDTSQCRGEVQESTTNIISLGSRQCPYLRGLGQGTPRVVREVHIESLLAAIVNNNRTSKRRTWDMIRRRRDSLHRYLIGDIESREDRPTIETMDAMDHHLRLAMYTRRPVSSARRALSDQRGIALTRIIQTITTVNMPLA